MRKKLLIFIIAIVVCSILSALTEVFVFNSKALFSNENNQSIESVSFHKTENKTDTTLELDITNTYVNKLHISYSTDKDVDYSIIYTYSGLYDKSSEDTINDIFDDSFDTSIINLDKIIQSISIKYNTTDDLSIQNISIDNSFHFNIYRAIFIFLALMLVFLIICFYKAGFTTERIHFYFAIICALLGTMIIVAQPTATFYSWDDQIHFERTMSWFGGTINYSNGEYHLSDVNVINSAGKGSVNSAEEKNLQNDFLNSDYDNQYTKTTSRLPSFDKISYIPMAIGYNLAKLIHLPFTACFQIGKMFNLLFYILLMAYAIKTIKIGKRLLAVIALLPSNIFLASEYSYDPAVLAGLTVFLAHVINLFLDKDKKLDFKTCLIMICALSYACFAKAIYMPFALLVLLVPKNRFDNPKQSKLVKLGFTAITILFLILSFLPSLSGGVQNDPRGGNTSVNDQASLIISHPFDFASVMNNHAVNLFSDKLFSTSSVSNFSYMGTINTHSNTYYILLILLVFVFFTDNQNNSLSRKQRFAIIFSSLITIAFIWGALYLSFTPVGSSTIDGVQNRYFLPLLFPLLLALQLKNIRNTINSKLYNTLILSTSAIATTILIYSFILVPYSS